MINAPIGKNPTNLLSLHGNHNAQQALCIKSVSYTHLDVYKRQESVNIVTNNTRTPPADDPTTSNIVTLKLTKSTEKLETSSTKAVTKSLIKTTKASLPLKTTTDEAQPTEVRGSPGSGTAKKPLLSIPQWFAVFLGTFLTIFLIFLSNIWYKAKMTPDNSKPSIELVKNGNKNDRPKSWQDTNVPLDFMSLHIELPKESKVEMTCAENPAFEGDQPDNPSSLSNSSFEEVTLTKL
ncbi:uncharacterized protein LOC117110940 [Anneissia japonica]|uniref:uncharacterized protein LOC117110940 n=1 Tax=Anneissia japonica TaxID=1529436 RepID=UPI0014257405|nr:uncharacterized protein LOC117110940 [Anneissia japonica]